MAHNENYIAPKLLLPDPASSPSNASTAPTIDSSTSSSTRSMRLVIVTNAIEEHSDAMASEESSLVGCDISSPSNNSADETNEPVHVLQTLPENEPTPPESATSKPSAGSATDEEQYYASDEYSTSSDENLSPAAIVKSVPSLQSFAISDAGLREEPLGALFAASSSEEETHRCIKKSRLPNFGRGPRAARTTAVRPVNDTKVAFVAASYREQYRKDT